MQTWIELWLKIHGQQWNYRQLIELLLPKKKLLVMDLKYKELVFIAVYMVMLALTLIMQSQIYQVKLMYLMSLVPIGN
jgi:hypothetical protein